MTWIYERSWSTFVRFEANGDKQGCRKVKEKTDFLVDKFLKEFRAGGVVISPFSEGPMRGLVLITSGAIGVLPRRDAGG